MRECRQLDVHNGMAARADFQVGGLSVCAAKALLLVVRGEESRMVATPRGISPFKYLVSVG